METQVTADTICIPSEDVVVRLIEDDLIIVPLVSGIGDADDELYTLNETGKAIWHKLDGQRSLAIVTNELAGEFSSSGDEIKADVLGFAAEMVKLGILAVRN